MKNPSKAQIQVVIDTLTKVLPYAQKEEDLNMMDGSLCGTIHCHGGWYYVACKGTPTDDEYVGDYDNGANLMAIHLGAVEDNDMKEGWQLREWAQTNPDIWGNDQGKHMFCAAEAFTSDTRPDGAKTLADIISHWTEVQGRLPE